MSEETKKKDAGAESPAPVVQKSEAELKLEKELQAALDIIAKQSEEMTVLAAKADSKKSILKSGGKLYKCLAKGIVYIDQKPVKAEDLVKDAKLVERLIKEGSGLFKEVVEPKTKKGGV